MVLATTAVAATATALGRQLPRFEAIGNVVGTVVSASFLFTVAATNWTILGQIRAGRRGGSAETQPAIGMLGRLLRPLFRVVTRSWHMLPLGVLFGLGFDTATEVALLGISATQVASGMPLWSIMVFPALFAAGMSLIDTTDGILMLGAYAWACGQPDRKRGYDLVVTLISVVVATAIGVVELASLLDTSFDFSNWLFAVATALDNRFDMLGLGIVCVFGVTWLVSVMLQKRADAAAARGS